MTTNFKPGDTVRLTGKLWGRSYPGRSIGDIVTITRINRDGDPAFRDPDGHEWLICDGYEAELVETERPGENGEFVPIAYPTVSAEEVGVSRFYVSISRKLLAETVTRALSKATGASVTATPVPTFSADKIRAAKLDIGKLTVSGAIGISNANLDPIPAPAEYNDPRYENLIRAHEAIQATLRRRKEQINEQRETITALQAKVTEYAARLEDRNWGIRTDELDAMLREFHEAFEVERNYFIDPYGIDLDFLTRQHMLQEEVNELLLAIREGDPAAVADALGDIIYIAAGTADLAGIPIMRVLRVIHAANMRKLGPDGKPVPHPTVPGKIGKPEGWTGPEADIRKVLKEAGL